MAVGEQLPEGEELLSFVQLEDGPGIKVIDRIERRHLSIETGSSAIPERASSDIFDNPVDQAVTISTDQIFIPHELCVVVWNSLGFMISEITSDDVTERFPQDRYVMEIPAPVRLYVTFDDACLVDMSSNGVSIETDSKSDFTIGARSEHKHPAATITTSEDIGDLMESISYFGSALKTITSERSYPSHRGHPPTVELGNELEIPQILTRPDTGISIQSPENYQSVFTLATLTYYLGAEIIPGKEPRITTDQGFAYALNDSQREYEDEVERVLKQVFFLDCLTRTEGLYQIDLHERNQVEDHIGIDFAELYEQPVATQIESYLDVPYHLIKPHLPDWKMTAHVTPEPRYAETLPFIVNDLAVIKTPDADSVGRSPARSLAAEEFVRSRRTSEPTQSRTAIESAPSPSLVRINEEDSIEQTWIGEGAPLGASKAMVEAFHNRLGRTPSDDDIDITVVCNASEMSQEKELVNNVYGSREELPFDVSIRRELTVSELRSVLEGEVDFFHYIGHIDVGGFECSDGRFDASTLDHTGVDVFFLNACTSYDQGRRLIEAGSIAGVVTLQDVINSGAERVGMTLARLLNCGFPLRAAMNIAKKESIMGGHYLVIGDGSIDIAQPEGFVPALCKLTEKESGWRLQWISLPTYERGMGAVSRPFIEDCNEFYLTSGENGDLTLSSNELRDFLELEEWPVQIENKLTWSTEFEL